MYLYKVPFYIYQNLPIASLLSAVITMTIMASKNEITVLRSFGQGPWQCSKPLFAGGIISCCMSLLLGEFIIPITQKKESYFRLVKIEKRSLDYDTDSNWFRKKNKFLFFGKFKSRQNSLHEIVQITVNENFRINKIHQASSAIKQKKSWKLYNSRVLDTSNPNAIQFYPNKSLKIDFKIKYLNSNLLEPQYQSIAYNWDKAKNSQVSGAISKAEYSLLMHQKLSYIISALLLVLIGLRAGFFQHKRL